MIPWVGWLMIFKPWSYWIRNFYRGCRSYLKRSGNSSYCLAMRVCTSRRGIPGEPRRRIFEGPWREASGRSRRRVFPRLIQFKIHESHLKNLRSKYQISSSFELEVLLETDRACNPPSGWLTLYEEYFFIGLWLSLFLFFIKFFRAIGLSPCIVMPNIWRFICNFLVICIMTGVYPMILLFRAFFSFDKHHHYRG